jgi:hypothetical protein
MASNKIFNSQPAVLATLSSVSGGNLFNTFTSATPAPVGYPFSQPYAIIKHVRVANLLTTAAATVSLFKGATGTQLSTQAWAMANLAIPAQSYADWYGQARFDSTDFLTGVCNLSTAAVITIEGEIGLS